MSIYARKYICTVAAFACVVAAPSHAQSTDAPAHTGNKPSNHDGRRQRSIRTLHKRRAADRIARNASRRATDKKGVGAGDVHTAHSAVRIVKGGKDRGVATPVRSAPVKRDSSIVATAPGVFEEAINSTAPASSPAIPSARGYSLRPLVGSLLGAAVFAEFLRGRDVDTSVGGISGIPATPGVPVKPTTPSDTSHTTTPPVTPTPSDTTHTTTTHPVTPTPSDTAHTTTPPVTPTPSDTGKKTIPVVPPVVPGPVPSDTTSMPPITTTTAPEPGTIFLTATGLAALAAAKKRRYRR